MLYSIMAFCMVLVSATPILCIYCIKFGMRMAERPEETAKEPTFNVPKKEKKVEISPEEQRYIDILANIEAYDGTANGQKEIKNGI